MRNRKIAIIILVIAVVIGVAGFVAYQIWQSSTVDRVPDIPGQSGTPGGGTASPDGGTSVATPRTPTSSDEVTDLPDNAGNDGVTDTRTSVNTAHTSDYLGVDIVEKDVPAVAGLPVGRSTTEVQNLIVQHIRNYYPDSSIHEIRLIGNGSSPSQQTPNEIDTWSSYVVALSDGEEVGLFITCSNTLEPYLTEANTLMVGRGTMYDVQFHSYRTYDGSGEQGIPNKVAY